MAGRQSGQLCWSQLRTRFSARTVDDSRFKFVSYHFEDEAELKEIEEPELQQLMGDLTTQ